MSNIDNLAGWLGRPTTDTEPPFDPFTESQPGVAAAADDHADTLARFPATDLAALLGDDRPERRWTVGGFLAEGGSHSIIAQAGAGKSLLVLHLSLCVASGKRFLGRDTQQRRVIYIDLENSEVDLAERLDALNVTEDEAARLVQQRSLIHLCLPPIDPLDTQLGGSVLAGILDAYEVEPGDLLVLDSTQRMVAGDENSADTWRAFYRHTATMLKRRGVTVVRLDNHGKDDSKGARGSSSKRDDVDAEWQLRRGEDLATEQGNFFTLKPTKGRMLSALEPIQGTYTERVGGTVRFDGISSRQDRNVLAAIRLLDDLRVPADAGQIAAWEAVKKHENRPTRAAIREAVKKRQSAMPTPTAYPSGTAYADPMPHALAYPEDDPTNPQVTGPSRYADH